MGAPSRKALVGKRGPLAGFQLRDMRHALGVTQAELGRLLGVKELTVARWEKGEANFSAATDAVVRLMVIEATGSRGNMRALLRLCGNDGGYHSATCVDTLDCAQPGGE